MTSFLRRSRYFLKIWFSGAFLVGASYFAVKYLEENLTNLIVESTVMALNNPEVHQDVNNLFAKLLTRLLEDPISRARVTDFLKKTMKEQVFEDSAVDLVIKVLRTTGVRSEASTIMKSSSRYIVRDLELKEQFHDLTSDMVNVVKLGDKLKKIYRLKYSEMQIPEHAKLIFNTQNYDTAVTQNLNSIKKTHTQHKISKAFEGYAKSLAMPTTPSIIAPEVKRIQTLEDIDSTTSAFLPVYYENKFNQLAQTTKPEIQVSLPPPEMPMIKPPDLQLPLSIQQLPSKDIERIERRYITY